MFATQIILPSTAPATATCEGMRVSATHADIRLPGFAFGYRPELGGFRKQLNLPATGSEDAALN